MLFSFLKAPSLIGSITPSSSFLAKKMMYPGILKYDKAIELGAGSGAVTGHLIENFEKVICYEISKDLSRELTEKYNTVVVRNMDACECLEVITEPRNEVCTVFSSLPFTLMDREKVLGLLRGIYSGLNEGEFFICFFYAPNVYLPWNRWVLREIQSMFTIVDYSFVLLNVPPALVLVCEK